MKTLRASTAHTLSQSKHETDMTQGSIVRHLITFALPLLAGDLFQQLYNTVDAWVVGNFVSNDAFSAVGAVAPIINTFIGFFTGLSAGAGIVISQYFGAKRFDELEKAVHTSIVMTLALSVIFTIAGIFVVPYMLDIIHLLDTTRKDAGTYMMIYMSGVVGLLIYNIGSGILRAVGDSRRPFYYLIVCVVTNIVLDILFTVSFHMGVSGVAYATIISQGISAALIVITLLGTDSCVRVKVHKLKIDWKILKRIVFIGIPSGIQIAITAFSNVFVQSYITFFDIGQTQPDYMSGWAAYLKIDQLLFLPIQSVALACMTYVSQNLGSGKIERAKKGVRVSLLICLTSTLMLMIPTCIFAPQIVSFLNQRQNVVQNGTLFVRLLMPLQLFCCYNQVYAAAMRGTGNSTTPMLIILFSYVFFRQCYLLCISRICNNVSLIALGYPAGWCVCCILLALYRMKFGIWRKFTQ